MVSFKFLNFQDLCIFVRQDTTGLSGIVVESLCTNASQITSIVTDAVKLDLDWMKASLFVFFYTGLTSQMAQRLQESQTK